MATLAYIMSGLLIGAAFGFVLQRGRFCINSAFREVLFQDYTMLRAYLLAVAVTMIGANLVESLGSVAAGGGRNGRRVVPAGIRALGKCNRGLYIRYGHRACRWMRQRHSVPGR